MEGQEGSPPKSNYKCVICGDAGVGKTSFVSTYFNGRFSPYEESTIGAAYRRITEEGRTLHVWDTAGQERYYAMIQLYFRGSSGILFAFDASNRTSFNNLERVWLLHAHPGVLGVLVALKCDLPREVLEEEGQALARKHGLVYFETSAKANTGVRDVFDHVLQHMRETCEPYVPPPSPRSALSPCCSYL